MDPTVIDVYRFFAFHSEGYKKNLIAFNKAMPPQTILDYSTGYGYEDREFLFDFLNEFMPFLRDKEYLDGN